MAAKRALSGRLRPPDPTRTPVTQVQDLHLLMIAAPELGWRRRRARGRPIRVGQARAKASAHQLLMGAAWELGAEQCITRPDIMSIIRPWRAFQRRSIPFAG
jgi:hypothetical protein